MGKTTTKKPAARKSATKRTITKVVEEEDRLIPAEQARERLGLTERQERTQIARGCLKPVKIGPRLNYYRESYIEDVIENGSPG